MTFYILILLNIHGVNPSLGPPVTVTNTLEECRAAASAYRTDRSLVCIKAELVK